MVTQINAELIDTTDASWHSRLLSLLQRIPPHTPTTLFPAHFLESTLPRIGGKVVVYSDENREIGVGLLFPRAKNNNHSSIFTLRFHPLRATLGVDARAISQATEPLIAPAQLVFYNPQGEHSYNPTQQHVGAVEIGQPTQDEALQIPQLQQQVWGATPNECYPFDIHSVEFAAGTSLVARVDGQLAGFLLGFTKFGGYPLPAAWEQQFHGEIRLESQIMGVLPQYRGLRISALLKQQQAIQAQEHGMEILNWTADPLQYVNAALNFALLRAIAFDFLPNLYSFRNELNRVPASRFGLSWLVTTKRVQEQLALDASSHLFRLAEHPEIPRLNQGWEAIPGTVDAPLIAIEIPENWNALQRDNLEQALRWRQTTDELFARHIGKQEGQYVITSVGTDQERRFLIGERVTQSLWERLGAR